APRVERPLSFHAIAGMPGTGQDNDVGLSGLLVVQPTMPPEISVPPELFTSGARRSPTTPKYHHHGSGFHGSPVEPSTNSDDRSCPRTGSSPPRISPRIAVGEIPRSVTRCRSTIDQTRPASG